MELISPKPQLQETQTKGLISRGFVWSNILPERGISSGEYLKEVGISFMIGIGLNKGFGDVVILCSKMVGAGETMEGKVGDDRSMLLPDSDSVP